MKFTRLFIIAISLSTALAVLPAQAWQWSEVFSWLNPFKILRDCYRNYYLKKYPITEQEELHFLNLIREIEPDLYHEFHELRNRNIKVIERYIGYSDNAGMYFSIKSNHYSLLIGDDIRKLPLGQQKFLIAHEIGHWKNHDSQKFFKDGQDYWHMELEADAFAIRKTLDVDSAIDWLSSQLQESIQWIKNHRRSYCFWSPKINSNPDTIGMDQSHPPYKMRIAALEALRPEIERLKADRICCQSTKLSANPQMRRLQVIARHTLL